MSATASLLLLASSVQPVKLTDIRLHLFYESSGRLSPDLSQQPDFAGWNVIIGEGSAEEPANDLMVVSELQSPVEQHTDTPLKVRVTDGKGKVLASRRFDSILITAKGRAYLPLWVPNAGCAGKLTVRVQFGSQRRVEVLELHCGE